MTRDNPKARDLTTAEVAALLDVAENTVRNWAARGELESRRLPDPPGRRGNLRFPWASVAALADKLGLTVAHPDQQPPA